MAGNRQHIIHGLRDGIPIAMGYFAVAFSLGIVAGSLLPQTMVTALSMSFYGMFLATPTPWPGVIALLAGIVAAWFRLGLFPVAAICCVIVYF